MRELRRIASGGSELLTPEDVAQRCHLSVKAVYRAISCGDLPAAKLRGRLRVHPDDLDAWIVRSQVRVQVRPACFPVPSPAAPVRATLHALRSIERTCES